MVGNACGRLQQQAESLTGRYASCCAAGSGPPLPYLDGPNALAESSLVLTELVPNAPTGIAARHPTDHRELQLPAPPHVD